MSKTFERENQYPLCWPVNFPRTKARQSSKFQTTIFQALENVTDELRRFSKDSSKAIKDLVISSNYALSDSNPEDAGVAVYFTWDGERTCIPVDRYRHIEDNLQAIYHCIVAKRTMLRHGGINLVKAAFRGYTALPNPESNRWREILGYEGEDLQECKKIWRAKIRDAHPDNGGSDELAAVINLAWDKAKEVLRSESP